MGKRYWESGAPKFIDCNKDIASPDGLKTTPDGKIIYDDKELTVEEYREAKAKPAEEKEEVIAKPVIEKVKPIIEEKPKPIPGRRIKLVIDPGHGGDDPGACGFDLREKDLTLYISRLIKKQLEGYNVEVLMTRDSDVTMSLTGRANFANRNNTDYFLSVHINAAGGTGFESFTYPTSRKADELRVTLHDQIMLYLQKYGVKDRGKKYAKFTVLAETNMPACLIENLFIDNANDAELLKNDTFIHGLANEIAYGLVKTLGLVKVG